MCPRRVIDESPPQNYVAKLWILLIGVDRYQDRDIPSLKYSALDCQGLSEALTEATETFPAREIQIHHDFAQQPPTLEKVRHSLQQIISAAQPKDTVLFYFSGHGISEPNSQQVFLCLADTEKDRLLITGLGLQELLKKLGNCAARQQLVWLDACHSGSMTLKGSAADLSRNAQKNSNPIGNSQIFASDPTSQLLAVLRQKAAQSQGFYALLSCDSNQQSWEFPELGHGVFTYYLMRGLRGEAADAQGTIEADNLYQYVYHQTLRYIDKNNQQIRLINQQKRNRGEEKLQAEYPLQTPKRIVEGFGKVILGKRTSTTISGSPRQALVIDALPNNQTSVAFSKVLRNTGEFALEYWPRFGQEWSEVREAISVCLGSERSPNSAIGGETSLLYLRGYIEESEEGVPWLVLGEGVRISRSWLRQTLRRSSMTQQIIILDCPGGVNLVDWVEDLQMESERGQCIIAAAPPLERPGQFTAAIWQTLKGADVQIGLSAAAWIAQLQIYLADTETKPEIWLSAIRGIIEILPGRLQPKRSTGDSGIFDLGLCPYMGLKAFTEENTQYFYGRELLTQKSVEHICHHPTLAVVGASGSGKSSLVQAGTIAQLRQGKFFPGSDRWRISCFRPGVNPLDSLARALVDPGTIAEKARQQMEIEALLAQGSEGFVPWLRSRPEPIILLTIDQFEEIFTLALPQDRQLFLDLILGAVKYAPDRFKLIITLRADFISSCLEIPELAKMLQSFSILVTPYLNEEDYRQAIVKPAEQVGLKIEPGLVEILVQELDRAAGDLPLLQFVLEKLWERRQSGKITAAVYKELGGLKGALERQAQAVYDRLDPDAQACARWIFLNLTQLGEGTEDTRRRVAKSDLIVAKYPKPLVDRTLQALTAAKIIVLNVEQEEIGQNRSSATEGEDLFLGTMKQEVTVEVIHEILIRHWSTLRWWLEENRARLRSQRQIEQAAMLWKNHDRQEEFLLRGIRLAEAEELYLKYTDELSTLARDFIATCLGAQQKEQTEATKRLRQTQIAAAAIGMLGIFAITCSFLAYRLKNQAHLQEIDALDVSSEALLLSSNRQLESLVASIKAGKQLQKISPFGKFLVGDREWQKANIKTVATLQQAIDLGQEINRLEKHTQQVNAVSYSIGGQLIATASDDNTIHLSRSDGNSIASLKGHLDRVISVAFSPDGQTIASASADRTIKIWRIEDLAKGQVKLLLTLKGHQDEVTTIAFSPNGKTIASGSRDRSVRLWTLDGRQVATLSQQNGGIDGVSFSPDGKTIASASEDSTIQLWRVDTRQPLRTLSGHTDRVTSIAFSPDSQKLVSGSGDSTVKIWNVADGKLLNSWDTPAQVNSVSVDAEGKQIAAATANTVKIWNWHGTEVPTSIAHGGEILSISFSPHGDTLASSSVDKTVRIWLTPQPSLSKTVVTSSVSFNPQSLDIFATAKQDGTIELWQIQADNSKKLLRTFPGDQKNLTSIAFSPDGEILATAFADKTIQLWQVNNGSLLTTISGHQDSVNGIAFSPDSKLLASASADRTIKLWTIVDGKAELAKTLKGHQDRVNSVAFSVDGKMLASGSDDKTVRLWNVESGREIAKLEKHNLAVSAVKFSPDGQTLASASWDNTIELWQIDNTGGKPLKTLTGHQSGVTSIDFSADGQFLASGSEDGKIKLWHVTEKMLLKSLIGHRSSVNSLSFNQAHVNSDDLVLVSAESEAIDRITEKPASTSSGVIANAPAKLIVWNLNFDYLLSKGCDRAQNYLQTNPNLLESDTNIAEFCRSTQNQS